MDRQTNIGELMMMSNICTIIYVCVKLLKTMQKEKVNKLRPDVADAVCFCSPSISQKKL